MPSDRFIAREDDVLDLETGIRYSTADDAESVADLLNSTPSQHVSGDVVAAELQGAIAELAGPFGRMALELGTSHEAVRKGNVAFAKLRAAAALASPEPESVVLEGELRYSDVEFFFLDNERLDGVTLYNAGANRWATRDVRHYDFGPVRLTITPIKERGDDPAPKGENDAN